MFINRYRGIGATVINKAGILLSLTDLDGLKCLRVSKTSELEIEVKGTNSEIIEREGKPPAQGILYERILVENIC
jgi:hypothetical protein